MSLDMSVGANATPLDRPRGTNQSEAAVQRGKNDCAKRFLQQTKAALSTHNNRNMPEIQIGNATSPVRSYLLPLDLFIFYFVDWWNHNFQEVVRGQRWPFQCRIWRRRSIPEIGQNKRGQACSTHCQIGRGNVQLVGTWNSTTQRIMYRSCRLFYNFIP